MKKKATPNFVLFFLKFDLQFLKFKLKSIFIYVSNRPSAVGSLELYPAPSLIDHSSHGRLDLCANRATTTTTTTTMLWCGHRGFGLRPQFSLCYAKAMKRLHSRSVWDSTPSLTVRTHTWSNTTAKPDISTRALRWGRQRRGIPVGLTKLQIPRSP